MLERTANGPVDYKLASHIAAGARRRAHTCAPVPSNPCLVLAARTPRASVLMPKQVHAQFPGTRGVHSHSPWGRAHM